MMTEDQITQIFAFLSAAESYLANMSDRGDNEAKGLHAMAIDILNDNGESVDGNEPIPTKSEIAQQMAKEQGIPTVYVRLAQYDPEELKGIPADLYASTLAERATRYVLASADKNPDSCVTREQKVIMDEMLSRYYVSTISRAIQNAAEARKILDPTAYDQNAR